MRRIIVASLVVLLSVSFNTAWAFAHFGPTKRGDTLWQIAEQSLPSKQISVTEMIKAIKQLNPSAFVGGNHNILKTGVVLQVPASLQEFNAVMGKTTPEQAVLSQETGRELGALSQDHQAQLRQAAEQAASVHYAKAQQQVQQLQQQLNQANNRILYLQQLQQQAQAEQQATTYWGWLWFVVWLLTIGLLMSRRWWQARLSALMLPHVRVPQISWRLKLPRWNIKAVKDKLPSWPSKPVTPASQPFEAGLQAELDVGDVPPLTEQAAMPLSEPTMQAEFADTEPYQVSILDDPEKPRLLEAINAAPNDTDRHMALLQHYVELESQHGFDEHVKEMIKIGVMEEGDSLWARVRKLYLNTWVYDLT